MADLLDQAIADQGGNKDLLDQAIAQQSGGGDLLDQAMSESGGPSLGRKVVAFGARVGLPIVGGALGGPVGAVAGGAAGEALAEEVLGQDVSLPRIAVGGALGAIPAGRVAKFLPEALPGLARSVIGGAVEGTAITTGAKAATQALSGQKPSLPTAEEAITGAVVGGAAGAAGHALEGRVRARAGEAAAPADLLDKAIAEEKTATPPAEPTASEQAAPTPEPALPEPGAVAGAETPGFQKITPTETVPPAGETPADRFNTEDVKRLFRDEPTSVQDTIAEVTDRNRDLIETQTRGVQSDERRQALADLLVPSGKLPSGTAANSEQVTSLVNTADTIGNRVDEIQQALAPGAQQVLSDTERSALEAELKLRTEDLGTLMVNISGVRSEAGRGLRVFRFAARKADIGALARSARLKTALTLEEAGATTRTTGETLTGKQIFALLEQLPSQEERLALVRELKLNAGQPIADRVQRAFFTSILSRPITSLRNTTGNLIKIVTRVPTSAIASSVAQREAEITGQPATSALRDINLTGYKVGLLQGWQKAVETWKRGVTFEDLKNPDLLTAVAGGKLPQGSELSSSVFGPYDLARWSELKTKPLAAFGQGVRRILSGTDAFFRSINEEAAAWEGSFARARIEGTKEGFKGEALRTFIAQRAPEIRQDPNLAAEVERLGARGVYQETPGELAKKVMSFKDSKNPLFKGLLNQVIPFVKTPANITRQGLNLAFGPVFSEFVEGRIAAAGLEGIAAQRVRQQAVAEGVLGTVLMAPLIYLADKGLIHGDVPSDPKEKAQFYVSGKKANSIDIGGDNVSLQLFGPLLLPATIAANLVQNAKTAKDFADGFWSAFPKMGGSLLSQSFLDGLSDLFQTFSDHQQTGQASGERFAQFAGERAASFVPGLVQDIGQAADQGIVRQPQGFTESIQAALPVLRENVPPRVDVTGFPAARPGYGPAGSFLKDINPLETTSLQTELERLNASGEETVGITSPPRNTKIKAVKGKAPETLDGDNDTAFREAISRLQNRMMANRIETPVYQRVSDAQKRTILKKDAAQAGEIIRERAKTQILRARNLGTELRLQVETLLPPSTSGLFKPTEQEQRQSALFMETMTGAPGRLAPTAAELARNKAASPPRRSDIVLYGEGAARAERLVR